MLESEIAGSVSIVDDTAEPEAVVACLSVVAAVSPVEPSDRVAAEEEKVLGQGRHAGIVSNCGWAPRIRMAAAGSGRAASGQNRNPKGQLGQIHNETSWQVAAMAEGLQEEHL
ncbi:hypothetical protein ACJZ2D_000666 [Fusarium nematophilum]